MISALAFSCASTTDASSHLISYIVPSWHATTEDLTDRFSAHVRMSANDGRELIGWLWTGTTPPSTRAILAACPAVNPQAESRTGCENASVTSPRPPRDGRHALAHGAVPVGEDALFGAGMRGFGRSDRNRSRLARCFARRLLTVCTTEPKLQVEIDLYGFAKGSRFMMSW